MTTTIEITSSSPELSFRQRWNHYLVLLFGLTAFFIGVSLRDNALNATRLYANPQAGIQAEYPENWLIDQEGDYIFRVRNMAQIGFKTTIQVAEKPVGGATSTRSILDALNLNRSQILAAYKVLSIEDSFPLPNEQQGTGMNYTYANIDNNPFLESVPVVIHGVDILTIKRGQAIIITFLSDASTYRENYPTFEHFLASMEF
jgi:hypothetical protein